MTLKKSSCLKQEYKKYRQLEKINISRIKFVYISNITSYTIENHARAVGDQS